MTCYSENLHDPRSIVVVVNEERRTNFSKTNTIYNKDVEDKETTARIENAQLKKVDHYNHFRQEIHI